MRRTKDYLVREKTRTIIGNVDKGEKTEDISMMGIGKEMDTNEAEEIVKEMRVLNK